MRKFKFAPAALMGMLLIGAALGVFIVEGGKEESLKDAAFAAWLAEGEKYKMFDNITDARKAWSFVVYMSHYLEGRENGREAYKAFLEKWNIAAKKGKALTSI